MLRILLIDTFVNPVWEKKWLWLLFVGFWAVSWLFLDSAQTIHLIFFLFGLVVFTIPHGSSDIYLPAWILNPPWEIRPAYWLLVFCFLLVVGGIVWALSLISINFAVALFTGLIIWHWGSMDALYLYPERGPAWVIGSIGRGMLVFIAPLYFKPLETQDLILTILRVDHSHILSTLYSFSKYLLYFAIFLELLSFLANKFIEGRGLPRSMAAHGLESLLLLVTFIWVNPILSLTFYFLILHAVRHMTRVSAYIPEERGNLLDTGGILRALPNLFQRTNLMTFLAGFAMALWFAWQLYTGQSFREASLGCLLPLILLMIPHSLVSLLVDFNPKRLND